MIHLLLILHLTGQHPSLFVGYSEWNTLLPNDSTSDDEGVFIGSISFSSFSTTTTIIDLLHLLFPPSASSTNAVVYIDRNCIDTLTYGWTDVPCETIKYLITMNKCVTEVELVYSSSGHETESEGIVFDLMSEYVIEGEKGEDGYERVMKSVTDVNDVLFTLSYCMNVTFSSIAFTLQSSTLSHSFFVCQPFHTSCRVFDCEYLWIHINNHSLFLSEHSTV